MPKHGFTAPVAEWLAGAEGLRFEDDVLKGNAFVASVLDQNRVRELFGQHRALRNDHSYALWAVWMLERWARTSRAGSRSRNGSLPLQDATEIQTFS